MKKYFVLLAALFLILFFDGENKVMAQRDGSRGGDGQAQPRIVEYPQRDRPAQQPTTTTTTTTNREVNIAIGVDVPYVPYRYYNYQPYPYQPYICVVNQYSNYMNTVYYRDQWGYYTGRGYHIYRFYTHYSNGATAWNDRYFYF